MDNITSQMRLFADDSSLFTCVKGINETRETLLKGLHIVTDWAHQWKMVFNPNITKQASQPFLKNICTTHYSHNESEDISARLENYTTHTNEDEDNPVDDYEHLSDLCSFTFYIKKDFDLFIDMMSKTKWNVNVKLG